MVALCTVPIGNYITKTLFLIVEIAAGNAIISMAENAANQIIENDGFNDFDVGDMLFDGAIGGVSGALGGPGNGTKHLTNLGKQTVKRTFNATTNKGLRAGLKEARNALKTISQKGINPSVKKAAQKTVKKAEALQTKLLRGIFGETAEDLAYWGIQKCYSLLFEKVFG